MKYAPIDRRKLFLGKTTGVPRRFQDRIVIALFLLPGLIVFILFVIYPIFRSVYFSTFDWNGFGPAVDYIGLENYKKILTDEVFLKAIKNVLLLIALSLGIQLPAAFDLGGYGGTRFARSDSLSYDFLSALCNFRS